MRGRCLTGKRVHGIDAWTDAPLGQCSANGQADGHGPASGPRADVVRNSLDTEATRAGARQILFLTRATKKGRQSCLTI